VELAVAEEQLELMEAEVGRTFPVGKMPRMEVKFSRQLMAEYT
jgi:hypothetical protein